jgi:hypothetical protein
MQMVSKEQVSERFRDLFYPLCGKYRINVGHSTGRVYVECTLNTGVNKCTSFFAVLFSTVEDLYVAVEAAAKDLSTEKYGPITTIDVPPGMPVDEEIASISKSDKYTPDSYLELSEDLLESCVIMYGYGNLLLQENVLDTHPDRFIIKSKFPWKPDIRVRLNTSLPSRTIKLCKTSN